MRLGAHSHSMEQVACQRCCRNNSAGNDSLSLNTPNRSSEGTIQPSHCRETRLSRETLDRLPGFSARRDKMRTHRIRKQRVNLANAWACPTKDSNFASGPSRTDSLHQQPCRVSRPLLVSQQYDLGSRLRRRPDLGGKSGAHSNFLPRARIAGARIGFGALKRQCCLPETASTDVTQPAHLNCESGMSNPSLAEPVQGWHLGIDLIAAASSKWTVERQSTCPVMTESGSALHRSVSWSRNVLRQ